MKKIFKKRNFWIVLFIDFFLFSLSYFLSYFIRFEGRIPTEAISTFKNTILWIVPFKLIVFFFFNLYRGIWRYISITDFINILKATFFSSTTIILTILFLHRFQGYPRSVFVIDSLLTLFFISGIRLFIRFLYQIPTGAPEIINLHFLRNIREGKKRLLIIGAGDAGEKILRELQSNPTLKYDPVGFVDDNPQKHGMQIHGIPILGDINQVPSLAMKYKVDELLIAIASISGKEMRRIVEICKKTGLEFKIIPGVGELIKGRLTWNMIREVNYEDLLGRKTIKLESEKIANYLKDKNILITGAGGSIGSELCRQTARFSPKNIILLDCTENNLYEIQTELSQEFPSLQYTPILGNILNQEMLRKVFLRYQPNVIYHTAAYKHVPIVELNPWEAIINNIKGTQILIKMAKEFETERFILVSSDKAVRPSSVMGATKRIAELLIQTNNLRSHPTRFMAVRFGNVIGSSGSVVPLFKKQIKKGGPVTVTHPEVTRYFMTISEAAQLIMQAGTMGQGGEIFILDMGPPIKILDLARDLIKLSGFEPDEEIEIKFIGLRPGEKLHEELITEGEDIFPTSHEKIFLLRKESFDFHCLENQIEELIDISEKRRASEIKKKLKEILPEYNPGNLIDTEESHFHHLE